MSNKETNSIKKDALQIDLLNKCYHYHKIVINEAEHGIRNVDYMRLRASHRVVTHIDNVANEFTGKVKLIIDAEVIGNKKGTKWYTEYFSTPGYYRARKIAYRMFLENIEK